MSDIFLSYASKDRSRIQPLVTALEQQGWTVFWERAIATDKTWHDALGSELDVCDCVVVAWSQHSVRSRWVYEEAEEGKKKGALFPVILDSGAVPPLGFRILQTADLSQWQGGQDYPAFMQLVGDITAYFERNHCQCAVPVAAAPTALTLVQPQAVSSPVQPEPVLVPETTILAGGIDDASLQKARYQLACHLGPIANLLVRKAAQRAGNMGQLVQLLANELDDERQRADFIRRMKS